MSSLGGEVCALSEMVDRMALMKGFRGSVAGLSPGMIGLEFCESMFNHVQTDNGGFGEVFGPTFSEHSRGCGTRRIGQNSLVAGRKNPAGGLTNVASDMAPFFGPTGIG